MNMQEMIVIIIQSVVLLVLIGVIVAGRRKNRSGSEEVQALMELNRRQMEQLQLQHRTEMEASQKHFAEQRQLDRQSYEDQVARDRKRYEEQAARERERYEEQTRQERERYEEQRARDREQFEQQAAAAREQLREQSQAQFKALSLELLQHNAAELKSTNAEQMDRILKPLRDNLEGFQKAVTDSYVKENAAREALRERIDLLAELNASLGKEADNLAKALKGESKAQGDWGENILRTLLERAGLSNHVTYEEQLTKTDSGETLRDEEGHGLRPDVVVYLPEDRRLIIDSKVSLTDYLNMQAAVSESDFHAAAKAHLRSVKKHIDELAGKEYQKYLKNTAGYVMMFIPVEGAYLAAIQEDPSLWEYAWKQKVAIVTPTHLFSVMQMVADLWQQDNRNRSAEKMAAKAQSLHAKLILFMDAFQTVGKQIDGAHRSFETAFGRLAKGPGNVVKLTKDLEKMGGGSGKQIPARFADVQDDADSELPASAVSASQSGSAGTGASTAICS